MSSDLVARARPSVSAGRGPGRPRARRRLGAFVSLVALCALVAMTAIRACGYDGVTPFAELVAFTPWVALGAPVVMALCWVTGRRRLTLVAIACVLANMAWYAPFFAGFVGLADVGPQPVTSAGTTNGLADPGLTDSSQPASLRVMSINAKYGAADAQQIVRYVRDEHVDVLVVVELTKGLVGRLAEAGLDADMPHNMALKVGYGPEGSGLWSRTELASPDISDISDYAMPSAVVDVSGMPIRVTAVHPQAPIPGQVGQWAAQMQALGSRSGAFDGAQVLAGDFNGGYDHATFRKLLGSRFRDATRTVGRGLHLSWGPVVGGPAVAELDHIVTERDAGISDVRSLRVAGTDHRGLVATVTFDPARRSGS